MRFCYTGDSPLIAPGIDDSPFVSQRHSYQSTQSTSRLCMNCGVGELRVSDEGLSNLWYAASVLELRDVLDLCIAWAQSHIHKGIHVELFTRG